MGGGDQEVAWVLAHMRASTPVRLSQLYLHLATCWQWRGSDIRSVTALQCRVLGDCVIFAEEQLKMRDMHC
jgi:hypothetical protein